VDPVTKAVFWALFALTLPSAQIMAAVRVVVGPTPIIDGEARAARDVTVVNEKLAFALAVETPVPYGIPRGAIIDAAPVQNGKIGRDRVVFADFIPNNWSAWPNTYQHVDILERGPRRAVIRTVRDWGMVTISTLYTLESNSDYVKILTTMRNGGTAALMNLLSGLTLWPKGGFLFGVPGLAGMERGSTEAALADRVVAYDQDWSVTLHAPYVDHIANGSRDMFRLHSLAAGASRTFEAWLQIGASGDLSPVLHAEIDRKHLVAGTVRGRVTGSNGEPVAQPVVVVEKRGQPYAWALGRDGGYEVRLPEGNYELYATATEHSQSKPVAVSIRAGVSETRDFHEVNGPGLVQFSVADARSGAPLDACIAITRGQRPLVEFLGRQKFFTDLERQGRVDVRMAPGDYSFHASSGGNFLGPGREIAVQVLSGVEQAEKIALTPWFDPPARGWYSADLHHHADQAEAVTPPADLARSQLAAGLNVLFVSDHDSTVNHQALQAIADRRGVAFIAAVELSPSWGHFNAYPLEVGAKLMIDPGTASIDDIFKEARRLGAGVIQINHPFIPYGYFTSVEAGVAPGGFNPQFDLVEINTSAPDDDDRVVRQLWSFWNAGHRYYLAAGTDTHDVWKDESGRVRSFVHIDGAVSAASFAEALKAGHSYVSYGPLIFPTVMFGVELKVKPDQSVPLGVDLQAVAGLKSAALIRAGIAIDTRELAGAPQQAHVDFTLGTARSAWYALVVEDREGRKAYTDPIWLEVVDANALISRN
jgi:hypothetical protein